jgi:hypothetical protein
MCITWAWLDAYAYAGKKYAFPDGQHVSLGEALDCDDESSLEEL